jgi:hypothetical protein
LDDGVRVKEWEFGRQGMYVPGATKLSRGVSSGITAFGKTNAPIDKAKSLGLEGEDGIAVRTTLAKCVGTATLGGEPTTS